MVLPYGKNHKPTCNSFNLATETLFNRIKQRKHLDEGPGRKDTFERDR